MLNERLDKTLRETPCVLFMPLSNQVPNMLINNADGVLLNRRYIIITGRRIYASVKKAFILSDNSLSPGRR